MSTELKERKFVECFKSNKNGSCNYCHIRAWKPGYKIYAMQKDNHWIACTDRKCYLEQGGTLTVFKGEPLYPEEEIKLIQDKPNNPLLNKVLQLQNLSNEILTMMLEGKKL